MKEGDDTYWLGTDHLGRDIFSRIIYGSRISLAIGISAIIIGAISGISIGLVSGYFSGKIDTIFMRLGDMQLAFPFILLIIVIVAVLGPNIINIIVVLGITSWITYARIVRSEVLSLREMEFIAAARALGHRNFTILFKHLLPNVGSSCIVIATLEIARIILMESGLSFLGLGVQPSIPSWGRDVGRRQSLSFYLLVDSHLFRHGIDAYDSWGQPDGLLASGFFLGESPASAALETCFLRDQGAMN